MNNCTIKYEVIQDPDPEWSYLEQPEWEDRLAEFKAGDFFFVGIRAVAEFEMNRCITRITSPGTWGVESDSDQAYLDEVGRDELAELKEALGDLSQGMVELFNQAQPPSRVDMP